VVLVAELDVLVPIMLGHVMPPSGQGRGRAAD
jgi:hypothetical protein